MKLNNHFRESITFRIVSFFTMFLIRIRIRIRIRYVVDETDILFKIEWFLWFQFGFMTQSLCGFSGVFYFSANISR